MIKEEDLIFDVGDLINPLINNEYSMKFEQWKTASLQLTNVIDINENKELIELTKEFLKSFKLKKRDCYRASYKCSLNCPNVSFVFGYVTDENKSIYAHAWNKFN